MASAARKRLCRADVGAWLIRSRLPATELVARDAATAGPPFRVARCLRPS